MASNDRLDESLVMIQGAPGSEREPETEKERLARNVVDACSDYFSELSLHLKKLSVELPEELQSWFPQIAGGALQAQLMVLLEDLRRKEDNFGAELIVEFGRQISSRVNETLFQEDLRLRK